MSRGNREGTLRTGVRNISPDARDLRRNTDFINRAEQTFGPYVKKIDGKKVCPPGCIVDTCQPIVPSSPSRSMPQPTLLTTELPQGLPSPLEPTSIATSPANRGRRRRRFTVRENSPKSKGGRRSRHRKTRKIRQRKSKKLKKRRTKKYRKLP